MQSGTSSAAPSTALRRWLKAPEVSPEEVESQRRLLLRLVRVMVAVGGLAMASAFIDGGNDRWVTAAWYIPVFFGIFLLERLVRRGGVVAAGWLISLFFWLLVAATTLLFGGMQGQIAGTFAVSVMLVGSVIGGRAPVVLAIASSLWCAMLAWLEVSGRLPRSLASYRPVNAWSAVTVTLVLTATLLRNSLDVLRALHARAEAAARERDEALRRSLQLQKMELVGNLTSGIAHDFNNLLTVMASASQYLRARVRTDDAAARESLDDLEAATERAALITRQLLAFGRVRSNDEGPVEVGQVVRNLVAMLPRLLGPAIEIRLAAEEGAVVRSSRASLEQILLNLAVNARDAMPGGGELQLAVRIEGKTVALVVADSGAGMDEATRARIFEPFFTTKASGTGLGLATVRELVSRLQGEIELESAPGRGTRFVVRLPRLEGVAPEPMSPPPQLPARGVRERLLLVDDDPLVRRATRRELEAAGYEVVAVQSAREALGLLQGECGFQVLVTDVAMPGMSGDELARQLEADHPELAVVLFSGHRSPLPATLDQRRRAFVAKPARREELVAAITQARQA